MASKECVDLSRPSNASLSHALDTLSREALGPSREAAPPSGVIRRWRTRAVIQEIRALHSVEALLKLEAELRSVVESKEVRHLAKLHTMQLYAECCMEEVLGLDHMRAAEKGAITLEETQERKFYTTLFLSMKEEIQCREKIYRVSQSFFRSQKEQFGVFLFFIREEEARRALGSQEELMRMEISQRWLIEIGRLVQFDIAKQNASGVFRRAQLHSIETERAIKAICAEEERDRLGIGKVEFFARRNIAYDSEKRLCQVIRDDLINVSILRRRWKECQRDTYTQRCIGRLIDQETSLRLMIEQEEHTEYAQLYTRFMNAWRIVPQILKLKDSEVENLVYTIEVLERKYLYDQYHEETRQIAKQFYLKKLHIKQIDEFLKKLSESLVSLWREEEEAYEAIHIQYHSFLSEVSSLPALVVVELDEEHAREKVYCAEATNRARLKSYAMQDLLYIQAFNGVRDIALMESNQRNLILRKSELVLQTLPLERLPEEEAFFRLGIELEERRRCAKLDLFIQKSLRECAMIAATSSLLKHEEHERRSIEDDEMQARLGCLLERLLQGELHGRQGIRALGAESHAVIVNAHESGIEEMHRRGFAEHPPSELAPLSHKLEGADEGLRGQPDADELPGPRARLDEDAAGLQEGEEGARASVGLQEKEGEEEEEGAGPSAGLQEVEEGAKPPVGPKEEEGVRLSVDLRRLFWEFYDGRDALIFEELVERRGLRRFAGRVGGRAGVRLHSLRCQRTAGVGMGGPRFASLWSGDAGLRICALTPLYYHLDEEGEGVGRVSGVSVPAEPRVALPLGQDEVIFLSVLDANSQVLGSGCFVINQECYLSGFATISISEGSFVFRLLLDM